MSLLENFLILFAPGPVGSVSWEEEEGGGGGEIRGWQGSRGQVPQGEASWVPHPMEGPRRGYG